MSLFDDLVDEALKNRQDLAPLRVVVEKNCCITTSCWRLVLLACSLA